MKLERDVEQALTRGVKKLGLMCVKFVPDQEAGMPDRLILLPEQRCVWVELKKDDGVISPLQSYQHKVLREYGHRVVVLRNKKDVEVFLSELAQEKNQPVDYERD